MEIICAMGVLVSTTKFQLSAMSNRWACITFSCGLTLVASPGTAMGQHCSLGSFQGIQVNGSNFLNCFACITKELAIP